MLTQIIYAFEAAHQRGEEPRIEAFLDEYKDNSQQTFLELLYIDLEYRLKKNLPIEVASYRDRFPPLETHPPALRALIMAEVRQRRDRGENVSAEDYRERFPQLQEGFSTLLNLGDSLVSAPKSSREPTVPNIANHEIVRELGRGGMAVVYEAVNTLLIRRLAVKMILSGDQAGSAERERFRSEAVTVAGLLHPNIVQIYEVGEHEGQLWLAMELCEGGSLAEHMQGMPQPPRESALLVETLARAMQVAHQANVIHRDLKPANVLLQRKREVPSSEGIANEKSLTSTLKEFTPKIADFGLAKKLDTPGRTVSGMIVGTPSYMAPEQALGRVRQIGPTTDVYALGAILYESLTGRPPFRAASLIDTIVQVTNDDPVSPRKLVGKIPRDLETICLKCLHKDPARRYASASELADDLGRFQRGEPIRARRVGVGERFLRWCYRNPVVASLSAAMIALVVTGIVVERRQYQHTMEQRDRADQNFTLADEAATDILMSIVEHPRLQQVDFHRSRRELLSKAVALYEKLAEQHPEDRRSLANRARAYARLGTIRGELLQREAALAAYEKARDLYAELAKSDPTYIHDQARMGTNVGNQLYHLGKRERAAEDLQQAIELFKRATVATDRHADLLRDWSKCLGNAGIVLHSINRREAAEKAYRESLRLMEAIPSLDDTMLIHRSMMLSNLGVLLKERDLDQAEKLYRAALAISKEVASRRPDYPSYNHEVARVEINLSTIVKNQDKLPEAESLVRDACDRLESLVKTLPELPDFQSSLAGGLQTLAIIVKLQKKSDEAEKYFARSLEVYRRLAKQFPKQPDHERLLANTLVTAAMFQVQMKRIALAKQHLKEGLSHYENVLARMKNDQECIEQAAQAFSVSGNVMYTLGDFKAALSLYQRQSSLISPLIEQSPEVLRFRVIKADALMNLGNAYSALNKLKEAITVYHAGLETLEPLNKAQYVDREVKFLIRNCHWGKADAFYNLGKHKEAVPEWDRMIALIDGEKDKRSFRIQRAESLVRSGDILRGVSEATAIATFNDNRDFIQSIAKTWSNPGATWFQISYQYWSLESMIVRLSPNPHEVLEIARIFSLASRAEQDLINKETYARQAIVMLQHAVKRGIARDVKMNQQLETS